MASFRDPATARMVLYLIERDRFGKDGDALGEFRVLCHFLRVQARDHQNAHEGEAGNGGKGMEHFESIHAGHVQIGDEEVGGVLSHLDERVVTVAC